MPPAPTEGTALFAPPGAAKGPWRRQLVLVFLTVPLLTLRRKWLGTLAAVLSTLVCVLCGYTDFNIFDPMIFKSIFVVFGFALGFRNVRANARRGDALENTGQLFHTSWGILALYPSTSLPKVRAPLLFILNAVERHTKQVGQEEEGWWYSLPGLEPREKASQRPSKDEEQPGGTPSGVGGLEMELAPTSTITAFFVMAEEELERLEATASQASQARRRTFWVHKATFLAAYQRILQLCIHSVSPQYKAFVDGTLLLFGLAVPWGISAHDVLGISPKLLSWVAAWVVDGIVLLVNSMFVIMVFYGLNVLAEEAEDPFSGGVEFLDVDFGVHLRLFEAGLADYERRSALEERGVTPTETKGSAGLLDPRIFERNSALCGYGVWAAEQNEGGRPAT